MKKIMKNALSLFLGAGLLATAASALVLELPNKEEEMQEASAAELLSVTCEAVVPASNILPGRNAFTGTTKALTFDSSDDLKYFVADGKVFSAVAVEETDKLYGSANNAAHFTSPAGKNTNDFIIPFSKALDRPVALIFDMYNDYLAVRWEGYKARGYVTGGWSGDNGFKAFRLTNVAGDTAIDKIDLYMRADQGGTGNVRHNYFDNFAVIPYYKITYDFPAGQNDIVKYVLAEDDGSGNISLDIAADGTISGIASSYSVDETVTADGGESATFIGWALENVPTVVVTSVALDGADITLVPVFEGEAEELETYSAEYGEMIFNSDLEGNTYNATNATIMGILSGGDNVAVEHDGNTGYYGFGMKDGYFYSKAYAQGGGFEFAVPGYGTPIRYTTGSDVLGTMTIVFSAYNEGTEDASWYDYFKQPAQTSGFAWGDLRSAYSCGTAAVGGWNEIVYQNKYITQPTTIIGISQKASRRDVVFGDIAVYIMPSNALWLVDAAGDNRKYEIVSGTSYTFPESYRGEPVSYWTDGNNAYAGGESADLSAVAGKTFMPLAPAPDTLEISSIRSTGKQGLRFASFVDDDRRNFADSYGFLIAVASNVTDESQLVFNAAASVNGTNEYGVRYISGVAYDKSEGIDRIYATDGTVFGEEDRGEGTYFTAVLYNIDAPNYATAVTMRPYLEKDGTYFYGASYTRSIYEVACTCRTNGYQGLDEAGREYVDSILDYVEK